MIISELIELLEQMKQKHGDLPVTAMIDQFGDALAEIEEAEFSAATKGSFGFPKDSIELS